MGVCEWNTKTILLNILLTLGIYFLLNNNNGSLMGIEKRVFIILSVFLQNPVCGKVHIKDPRC